MTTETIIAILVGLVLGAYGFIFSSMQSRIKDLEKRALCAPDKCVSRFEKIEKVQDDMSPLWIDIRERLARIETALLYLAKGVDKNE
jgi:hypothetical protein